MMVAGMNGFSQDRFIAGLLPKLNVSTRVSGDVKLTANLESRHALYERIQSGDDVFEHSYKQLEASAIVSVKTRVNQSLSGGYTFIERPGADQHRLLQQYSIVSSFDAFRLGHRFASDQMFWDDNLEIRVRYRITFEKPLAGDRVDPKEFYFKSNNEYLLSFEDNSSDLEIRVLALIGYEFNSANSIEFGPGYRIKDFSGNGIDQAIWFSLNWYFSVN